MSEQAFILALIEELKEQKERADRAEELLAEWLALKDREPIPPCMKKCSQCGHRSFHNGGAPVNCHNCGHQVYS
jgi:hypothetical protein